jgi:hypothetical protein
VVCLRPAPPSFHAASGKHHLAIPRKVSLFHQGVPCERGPRRRHSASDSVLDFQGTPSARDEDIVRPASASVHRAGAGQHDGPGPALKGPASGAIGERAWRRATRLAFVSLKPHCGRRRFRVSPGTCWRCIVPAVASWHLRPSRFGMIREPFRQTALPPGSCLFVFALTKYEDGSA